MPASTAEKPHILIVEDEKDIATLVQYNLEKEGMETTLSFDGEDALLKAEMGQPDLIVLDWMLPLMSGIEVCRQIRQSKSTRHIPIIMLTARAEETDRVRGLDAGADDFVAKPFSPKELAARIRAVLRRANPDLEEEKLVFADIEMDLGSHKVYRKGEKIHLGPTEFRLLRYMMENPSRVFSREKLLDKVWGRDVYVEARTVDVHIRRLRKSLNIEGQPDLIRTVRSAGYALDHATE